MILDLQKRGSGYYETHYYVRQRTATTTTTATSHLVTDLQCFIWLLFSFFVGGWPLSEEWLDCWRSSPSRPRCVSLQLGSGPKQSPPLADLAMRMMMKTQCDGVANVSKSVKTRRKGMAITMSLRCRVMPISLQACGSQRGF